MPGPSLKDILEVSVGTIGEAKKLGVVAFRLSPVRAIKKSLLVQLLGPGLARWP